MTFTPYDFGYYGLLLLALAGYLWSSRTYRVGGVSSFFLFRNVSVLYFGIFSILLGKFVYEGTTLASAKFNLHLYDLMIYYAVVLLGVAAIFNQLPQRDVPVAASRLNIMPLLLVLAVKAAFLLVEPTPMQELVIHGFAAAHIKQFEWNQPGRGGLVMWFYVYFSPVLCVLFTVYYMRARSVLYRLFLLILMFETSGFYFSKSGLIAPLIVVLVLSGIKLRYLAIGVLIGILAAFSVRLGTVNLASSKFVTALADRLVEETGYANPQLKLYESEHPPLGYQARYYLGFKTLFGIEPAVDASRLAYANEEGHFGATSSGHAAVSMYAFWGPAFYLVLPILLAFIFYVDRLIVNRLRTSYDLAAYLFVTYKSINYLTVDIQRLVNFGTLIEITFLCSVLLIWLVGKVVELRAFSAPITLYGSYDRLKLPAGAE